MSKRLRKWELKPLINRFDLTDKFIDDIIKSQTYFATAQIDEINNYMDEYNRIIKSVDPNTQSISPKYISAKIKNIERWKSINKIRHLTKPKLNVIDTNKKMYRGGDLNNMGWIIYLLIFILIIVILISVICMCKNKYTNDINPQSKKVDINQL
jgi:hypothetical protein